MARKHSSKPQWAIDAEERAAKITEAATVALEMPRTAPNVDIMDVDGALRLMMDYTVDTAFSPQPLFALAGGIAAVGTAAGRRYQSPSGLRSNVFIIALGESGSGKDQPRKCIRRAFARANLLDYLGGRKIASDQAIFGALEHHPVKLFLLNEFGHLLAALKGKNAASFQTSILSTLTELFTSAGEMFSGTEYAKVAKDENGKVIPTPVFYNPHVCVYGDTVPDTLWSATSGGALADGSLARYLCFKTSDDNPRPNIDHADLDDALPSSLADYLSAMSRGPADHDYGGNLGAVMSSATQMVPYRVPEDRDAKALRSALAERQWSWKAKLIAGGKPTSFVARHGEHVGTLAMIRAVSRDPERPIIGALDMAWAEALSRHCIGTMMAEADANVADSQVEGHAKRLLGLIRKAAGCGLTGNQLAQRARFVSGRERAAILADLVASGEVTAETASAGGRPRTIYTATATVENGSYA